MKTTKITDDPIKSFSTTTTELIKGIERDAHRIEQYSILAGICIGLLMGIVAFGIFYYFNTSHLYYH